MKGIRTELVLYYHFTCIDTQTSRYIDPCTVHFALDVHMYVSPQLRTRMSYPQCLFHPLNYLRLKTTTFRPKTQSY